MIKPTAVPCHAQEQQCHPVHDPAGPADAHVKVRRLISPATSGLPARGSLLPIVLSLGLPVSAMLVSLDFVH